MVTGGVFHGEKGVLVTLGVSPAAASYMWEACVCVRACVCVCARVWGVLGGWRRMEGLPLQPGSALPRPLGPRATVSWPCPSSPVSCPLLVAVLVM